MKSSCSFRITTRESYWAVDVKHLKGLMVKKDTESHAILTCLSGQLRTENLKAFNLASFIIKIASTRDQTSLRHLYERCLLLSKHMATEPKTNDKKKTQKLSSKHERVTEE